MLPAKQQKEVGFMRLGSMSQSSSLALTLGMVAAVQFLSVRLGLALTVPPQGNATIWPAAGIVLAILVLSRGSWLPILVAAFVGEMLANFGAGYPALASSGVAAINCLQAALGAWVLKGLCREPIRCNSVQQIVALGVASTVTIAITGFLAAAVINFAFGAAYMRQWRLWWTSDVVGVMVGAPLVLNWAAMTSLKISWARLAEAAVLFAGLSLSTALIFGVTNPGSGLLLSLLYVTFPFLIWAALRFGTAGTSTALLLVAVVSVSYTANDFGPMRVIGNSVDQQVIYLQIYLATAILSSLILAVLTEQRQQTEQALRTQTERFQKVFDHIPVMVSLHDRNGDVDVINREFEKVMGWTLEDLNRVDLLAECYPDAAYRTKVIDHMGAGQSGWKLFKTRVKDGQYLDTMWANVHLSDGSSIGIGQDVTEHRQLEEQLRHSHKMEAVGRLAGRIAHDFNNLLTVILGYTKLSLDHLNPVEDIRENLEHTRSATERAAALTQQLMTFSRKRIQPPAIMDLNELVLGMDGMMQRLGGADVVLSIRTDPELGLIKADPSQIEQGIMNLVANARDAMPDGGKLFIETASVDYRSPSAVVPAGLRRTCYSMLTVRDTGGGIDDETRSRIFEPFFTTKEPGKGTGLGLASVYAMVSHAGGNVLVDSTPGSGAEFRIYMPVAKNGVTSEQAEPARSATGSETILVVETEDVVRQLIIGILQRSGYHTLEVNGASEALRICGNHNGPIHLMLTETLMPGMDGYELTRRAAKLRSFGIVFMSSPSASPSGVKSTPGTDTHRIEKPFTEETLLAAVRTVLDLRPAARRAGT